MNMACFRHAVKRERTMERDTFPRPNTTLELTAKTLARFARGSAPALAFSCEGAIMSGKEKTREAGLETSETLSHWKPLL
jgi:hypothetical protein